MTKETQTNQVPAIEAIGTLTAAQDIVTIDRMHALMQGHELDLSHPRNDNRPAKFRIVEIDESDGSARFANWGLKKISDSRQSWIIRNRPSSPPHGRT